MHGAVNEGLDTNLSHTLPALALRPSTSNKSKNASKVILPAIAMQCAVDKYHTDGNNIFIQVNYNFQKYDALGASTVPTILFKGGMKIKK